MFILYAVVAGLVFVVQFLKGSKSGESFGRVLTFSLLAATFWPVGVLITFVVMLFSMLSNRTQ